MRKSVISDTQAKTIEQVKQLAPWAVKVVAVCHGWIAFESATDYQQWMQQNETA